MDTHIISIRITTELSIFSMQGFKYLQAPFRSQ